MQPTKDVARASEQDSFKLAIVNAWLAGYYHAGYTHDSAYAETEAQKYAGDTSPAACITGGKTGWPPGLLQDDDKKLSKWLASKPDARMHAREAAAPAGVPQDSAPSLDNAADPPQEPA